MQRSLMMHIPSRFAEPWARHPSVLRVRFVRWRGVAHPRAHHITHASQHTLTIASSATPQSSVLTAESLRAYIAETFLAGRVTVAASGASHAAVAALVGKTFGLAAAQGRAPAPAKYFGGEHRTAIYGDRTYMAVALPGAPAGAAPVATVFRYVLGSAVAVKWGAGASQYVPCAVRSPAHAVTRCHPHPRAQRCRLQAQVRAAAGGANVRLDTFGLSYADAGLLGVTAATDAASATAVCVHESSNGLLG